MWAKDLILEQREGGLHNIRSKEKGKCICIKVERIILLIAESKYIVITGFKMVMCYLL
jgi:hypothetical protein